MKIRDDKKKAIERGRNFKDYVSVYILPYVQTCRGRQVREHRQRTVGDRDKKSRNQGNDDASPKNLDTANVSHL